MTECPAGISRRGPLHEPPRPHYVKPALSRNPGPMAETNPVARRRTFAIISHPDAGKTTLTEKLLLYGGAVQLAG